MEAHLTDETAAPDPVTGNRIDQYADEDGVNQIHGEFGTFGHGS